MAKYEGRTINREDIKFLVNMLNDEALFDIYKEEATEKGCGYSTEEFSRKVFFSCFRLDDKVPAELCSKMLTIVARRFYNKEGSGYNGVIAEIEQRVDLYSLNHGFVRIREFLVHKAGVSDFYDSENRISYEMKTGAGDWLRSESPEFSDTIALYERKRTKILWQVNHKASADRKNDHDACFTIETDYKTLFAFLSEYKGKGLACWFVPNKNSGRAGIYTWKLQEFYSSKAKIEYLQSFDSWYKVHKK